MSQLGINCIMVLKILNNSLYHSIFSLLMPEQMYID